MSMQECIDYLLGEMDERRRTRFERRLKRDSALANELRRCSEDLASYADMVVADVRPSDEVWERIEIEVDDAKIEEAPSSPLWIWMRSKTVWLGTAAALLLLLNFAQWLNRPSGAPQSAPSKDREEGSGLIVQESLSPRSETPLIDAVEVELRRLRERVNSLDGMVASAIESDIDRQRRIRELQRERRRLESQIEYLEDNYMELLAVAEPLLQEGFAGERRLLELVSGDRAAPGEDGQVSGIWTRAEELLGDRMVAVLSTSSFSLSATGNADRLFRPDSALAEGFEQAIVTAPPSEDIRAGSPEPYALAFMNEAEGLGLVSFGNLPRLPADQRMMIWGSGEDGAGYAPIGELPTGIGGLTNVVMRLPGEAEVTDRLVVTVESAGADLPDQPRGRVLLETREP